MPLGKRTDFGDARYAGLEVPFTSSVEEVLDDALTCGFDFIIAPLADPVRRPSPPAPSPTGALSAPFLPHQVLHTMASVQLSNQIVGRVSAWIDPDAKDPALRAASLAALEQELAWANHLTVQACLLPPPPQGAFSPNYACAINRAVAGSSGAALWLLVPAAGGDAAAAAEGGGGAAEKEDPWEGWNAVRFACHHCPRLGVALEIGADLPAEEDLNRWWGEPLKAVLLQTEAFLTNRRGYPTLSKRHQEFLISAFQRNIQIIMCGTPKHTNSDESAQPAPLPPPAAPAPLPLPPSSAPMQPIGAVVANGGVAAAGATPAAAAVLSQFPTLAEAAAAGAQQGVPPEQLHPMRAYWEYLSFLFRKQPASGEQEAMEAPYRDFLQAPLQPLQDNLESQTYETFERDATKYNVYREAVRRALVDRVPAGEAATAVTVLMVVGAGRGPLVSASLEAARLSGRRLRVWAVEKNPNAVVHLNARAAAEGWQGVTIVHADMRDWRSPEPADILVSELLGSFGDNELSPECLDGAQRFLKPGGVSIPQAYTSFIHPITAHKLWTDVDAYDDLEHFETPFVVKLHRITSLAPPQPLFTFRHPNSDPVIDNSRAETLKFVCSRQVGAVCHGFAGYFDAQLYADVHLSIHPDTHTPSMSSWFPIYFPLREPFYVPPGAALRASFWRCGSKQKVWYEWAVGTPQASPVHNPNGRSYYVGL